MDSETNPVEVLFAESQRLEAFADFWRQRIDIEKVYLDNLSGLRIPDPTGNGKLQELATKTRELLIDELKGRRQGFERLQAAFKGLTDKFLTEEGPHYFDQWGRAMKLSLPQNDSLAAEIATAKSLTEKLAVEAQEKENLSVSSSATKATKSRSKGLSRLLDRTRKEQPYDTSSFLSADSAYRQKVQKINDEKAMIQTEIMPQNVRYVEHHRKCIVALSRLVSTFSAVHSHLARVLNVTSPQLRTVSSSMDASTESASFAERLDGSFASLIEPYQYTSYETSSPLRPTTMLFGCPLPDERDGASIGQRAIAEAFGTILSSAAKKHPLSLYKAVCESHKQQGNDIKLSALQLESLWDPSQENGGQGAVDYLAKAPSVGLLVYFLTRLPEPFLPLYDSDISRLAELAVWEPNLNWGATSASDDMFAYPGLSVFAEAGNRLGTARRCNLARLVFTLREHQHGMETLVFNQSEGVQILTRTADLLPCSHLADHFRYAIMYIDKVVKKSSGDSLILPDDFIEELEGAGLLE